MSVCWADLFVVIFMEERRWPLSHCASPRYLRRRAGALLDQSQVAGSFFPREWETDMEFFGLMAVMFTVAPPEYYVLPDSKTSEAVSVASAKSAKLFESIAREAEQKITADTTLEEARKLRRLAMEARHWEHWHQQQRLLWWEASWVTWPGASPLARFEHAENYRKLKRECLPSP